MTVTKQQQLEWLAKRYAVWPGFRQIPLRMSVVIHGGINHGLGPCHTITREEWQQERDKMQKQDAINDMTPVDIPLPDNSSWHCQVGGINYPLVEINNCTAKIVTLTEAGQNEITITAQDNSWHERGELPPVGCECEFAPKSGGAWVKTTILAITNQNVISLPNGESVEFVFRLSNVIFRPLRTDREKAIDAAMHSSGIGDTLRVVVEKLYDAGCIKEQTK